MPVLPGHPLIGSGEEAAGEEISCREPPALLLPRFSDVPAPALFSVPLPPAFYFESVVTVYIWDQHITVHLTTPGKVANSREFWLYTVW